MVFNEMKVKTLINWLELKVVASRGSGSRVLL